MNIKFINDTIYTFERDFPVTFKLVQRDAVLLNHKTGVKEVQETVFHNVRGALLPAEVARSFFRNSAYTRSNPTFIEGGFVEVFSAVILVRAKHMPGSYIYDLTTEVIFDNRRYDVAKWVNGPNNCFVAFALKVIDGRKPRQPITKFVKDQLQFSEAGYANG